MGKSMKFQADKSTESNYTVFHRYWISQSNIIQTKRKFFGSMKFSVEGSNNSGSSVYKCRLVPDDPQKDFSSFYAMKVMSYTKSVIDKKSKQYRPQVNPYSKTLQQIQTQFRSLQLLSKCHRVAKLKEMIHENTKRADDAQFFYSFLKKPKSSQQSYICLVKQFCNQGDLDSIVESKQSAMTEEEVISYAVQIIQGLYQLKKKRIIHRDLRLCNILVHNGEVKFSDFDTAFIGGYSTWKDVKNGIDIQTSPPQIIQLASKPDEQLQKYDPEDLYQRQEKSDIYFFGLALFKMIYGFNYQRFNFQTLSNMIFEKLSTTSYNKNVLNLLCKCLEQKSQKRIDFYTLYQNFVEIEKKKYFIQRSISRLYLSEEPICFASYKNFDNQQDSFTKAQESLGKDKNNSIMETNFQSQLKRSETERHTELYKNSFLKNNNQNLDQLWRKSQQQHNQQKNFVQIMQKFIKTMSIRSYYYECLYKAILSINLRSLKIKQDIKHVKQSKNALQQQLTIVLAFLFKLLFKTPFIRDRRYCADDLPYETMKLFKNIIKSDFIQNKMHCYSGKSKQFEGASKTINKINKFFQKRYETQDCFQPVYQNIMKLVEEIDKNVQTLLKLTIINLKLAYDHIEKKQSGISSGNIKEILFILIALQQVPLQRTQKNEMIVIWDRLLPLLNQELELDREELELIFLQYRKLYEKDYQEVNEKHIQYSVVMFGLGSCGKLPIVGQDEQDGFKVQQQKQNEDQNEQNQGSIQNFDEELKLQFKEEQPIQYQYKIFKQNNVRVHDMQNQTEQAQLNNDNQNEKQNLNGHFKIQLSSIREKSQLNSMEDDNLETIKI